MVSPEIAACSAAERIGDTAIFEEIASGASEGARILVWDDSAGFMNGKPGRGAFHRNDWKPTCKGASPRLV